MLASWMIRTNMFLPAQKMMPIFAQKKTKAWLIQLEHDRHDPDDTEVYNPYPHPIPLLLDIIEIHHLRLRILTEKTPFNVKTQSRLARELLERVSDFSPTDYHAPLPPARESSLHIINLFHSSVCLYAFNTLKSRIPKDTLCWAIRVYVQHRARLFELLAASCQMERFGNFNEIAIHVAGFEAAKGGHREREIVRNCLKRVSDLQLKSQKDTQDRLDAFWQSGKTEWEDCFAADEFLM